MTGWRARSGVQRPETGTGSKSGETHQRGSEGSATLRVEAGEMAVWEMPGFQVSLGFHMNPVEYIIV